MNYLEYLVEEIQQVVIASKNQAGNPNTRVINIMYQDGESVYFLTSNTKNLYQELLANPNVSLTGLTVGQGTLGRRMITLTGQVECIGKEYLQLLLDKNPFLYDLYKTEEARATLEVFRFTKAKGDYYDLTVMPPKTVQFDVEIHKDA